jgi:hypothetical protein
MPKCVPIGSYGQKQALRAHVWAENGPETTETRPDWVYRDRICISTRPSYGRARRRDRIRVTRPRRRRDPRRARAVVAQRVCAMEDLNLNPAVSVLLLFASLPDCGQNEIAVSDTLRLLSDLSDFDSNTTRVVQQHSIYSLISTEYFYIAELLHLSLLTAHYGESP